MLRKRCLEVYFGVDDLESTLSVMKQVFTEYPKAQGLSANQIGVLKRIAIMRYKGKEFFVINPKIELTVGGYRTSVESCVSTDKSQSKYDYYKVKRPRWIIVTYYDENGKRYRKLINSKRTRVFCHEIDHMDGRLITDEGRLYYRCKIAS